VCNPKVGPEISRDQRGAFDAEQDCHRQHGSGRIDKLGKLCVVFLALSLAGFSAAQLVQIGPDARHYCAKVEHIKANLHVPSSAQLTGHVEDESGAPFKNSLVELRRYVSEARQVRAANILHRF